MMGATGSAQRDSKCEEEEELHSGQDEITESSSEDKLLQKNGQISSQNGKTENQTDEMTSQSEERDLVDVGSGFVTLEEDASDTTDSILEDVSQTSTDNISKQKDNADDIIAKEENKANNKVNDTETGFKKIFRFAGFKFTVKKDKVEKSDVDEPIEHERDINAAGPSVDSWDTIDVNSVSTNEQDAKEIMNERMGGDASVEFPETHNEMAAGKISAHTKTREEDSADKGLIKDIPQSPEREEPMSPIKQFFSQGILASLRKKKKEGETPKDNEEELKGLDKVIEKETAKEDTACTCLDVLNGTFDGDKDIQLYKKDEDRPAAEGDVINSPEQDKVQASPFKRLFRKLSTRRLSETKPGDTNLLGENISENPQLSTELIKSQQEQETKLDVTQPADEMKDMSHEESKRKSDSTVSWENLICVRSAKTRVRKTSDSEDETQDKGEMLRRTTESPLESSTEGDHLTSSNEQGGSPAEEDSGSTWKSFKKLVTKKKSRTEESGSVEQMQSDTEITKDESSCSLRKLISGRKKKIKPDGLQENMSSDEGSKGTGTDIEDDETPGVVPLSEYERAEPKILNVMTDVAMESAKEKEMQPILDEDKPEQIQPSYNVKPLCVDAEILGVPIPTEYMEELTEFLSKHQQLSDIPEEGIIEESVATPASFVEWTTQDDTLDDDIVDMTADAVTAPEHASEHNEDESTEMVSAVSQLSESPKTSGNATPISPVYDVGESDIIFQDAVESICMVPSLSTTTKDKVPEAMAVSASEFIVESTTKTETKVLVAHKKGEATSICIGIVSQEIRAAEVVLPLPLFEGISEITHAVPTEFISEDLAEVSEAAGIVTDNVYEAEIKEIKTMLHEVLSHHEQSTILAETARKSEQQIIMVKNIQEEVSPVVQMEDVVNDSTELLNGIHEFTSVHAAVHGGTQLLEEQIITLNINRPDTEGPLQPALEEPVCEHLTQSSKIPVEVEKESRIPNVGSSAADVKQFDLVAVTGHSVVESVPDNSFNEVTKSIEDVVQVTEVAKSVMHSVVASESDPAMNQASEIIEDMTDVLVSDVKCSDTTAPVSNVIPISDSVNIDMDLEHEVQIKNDPSLHFVDSHTIQVKEDNTELQTENKIPKTVLALGTTSDVADGKIEMTEEEEKAKQMIEPTSAETMEEIVDEKIVYNFEAKNLSEILDKPTKESEGKERELNTFGEESTLPVATTNEQNAIEEAEDMSKIMLGEEKEHIETDTILIEDCKRNQKAGDEIYMLTLDTTETGEETKKSPAISKQPRGYEEVAQDEIQPPTTNNSKPVSQFSKLTADTLTTAVVTMSKEEDSARAQEATRPCVEDESDKLLAGEQEQIERATLEADPEITTEQETVETDEPFPKAEPQVDSDEPQTEILSSKPEQSQATESCHKPYEENNQATEAIIKMSETISTVTFIFKEETGVECNISDQPVATLQCLNGIDRVSLLEEIKIPCVDDQSVMSDTLLVEKQEDNETAKPEVNTEINTEHQETKETVLKVEPRLNTEHLQKEMLSIKPEESQGTESYHEPYEENDQVTGSAEITEPISSVVYEDETGVECKIFDQPVETGQCIKSVDEVPVSTMEHATEILFKDKAKCLEGFVMSETEGSEHVMEVIKASTYQASVEVVSEHKDEMTVDSEKNIVFPDVTEQEVVSEIDTANTAVTEKNIELTAALKLMEETTMTISDGQTVVTADLVEESLVVTENKPEPEVLTQVISELEAETMEVTESKADIIAVSEVQTETPVVTSVVTELEVEIPIVTTTEKPVNIEVFALTSVISKFESDLKSIKEPEVSTGTILLETPVVVSGIQTETDLILVQTGALSPILKEVSEKEDAIVNRPVEVTEPKLEMPMVTEVISHTSARPALEVQTIENSETLVRTCVGDNDEAQGSVVTSIKEDTDVGSLVSTTTVSEAQLKTMMPVVQTLVDLTATDVPEIQKPTDGQLIQEPEMFVVAQEIKETKLETPDAVNGSVLRMLVAKERMKAPGMVLSGQTEQIIQEAVLTSESEVASVKEDVGLSVLTLITEEPTVASYIKLPTASVAPVAHTPTIVPAEAQRATVVPVVETLAVSSTVKEVEMPFSGPEETHCDAQVAVKIKVKQPPLTGIEVEVTEIIEQVTQDEIQQVENTANPKEDSKSPEERSGRLEEVSVPMVKSLPGADDDVWEDAVDDISDQCYSTKTSGSLQDTTICHGDN